MKLSAINSLNTTKLNSQKLAKTKATNSISQTNSTNILNNGLQEALGRSQVNFCGYGHKTQDGFELTLTTLFGKPSENLQYNDKTGELYYVEYFSNGDIKQEMSFNPQTRQQKFYEKDSYGITTKTLITENGTVIEKRDPQDRPLLLTAVNLKGDKKISRYDYDRNRQVTKDIIDGKERNVRVFNLETKEEVFEGPLVIDTVKGRDGVTRTRNIINGQVYKTVETINGTTYSKIYSATTGLLTTEVEKNKHSILTKKYSNGVKFLEKDQDIKSGVTRFTSFGEDGQSITEIIEKSFDSKRRVVNKTEIDPATNTIVKETDFDYDHDRKTEHRYHEFTNIRKSSEITSISRDEYFGTIEYFPDGITPSRTFMFDEYQNSVETWYSGDKKNNKSSEVHRNQDGQFTKFVLYSDTGKPCEIREPHPNLSNQLFITQIDEYTGKRSTLDIVVSNEFARTGDFLKNGQILARYYYDESGKIKVQKDEFNYDGTITRKMLNRDGKPYETHLYNPDGTQIY